MKSYKIFEEGVHFATINADSAQEALEIALEDYTPLFSLDYGLPCQISWSAFEPSGVKYTIIVDVGEK